VREQGGGGAAGDRGRRDPPSDGSVALSSPDTTEPGVAGPRSAARRELGLAVGLCLIASSAALVAVGRTWATGTVAALPPLPAQDLAATGIDAGTPVRGLAVVGLAGVVAVLAARGWGRALVGGLLLLAGLGIAGAGLAFDADGALDTAGQPARAARTAWPLVAAASGALLAAAGGLVAVRGRRWAGMSQRYDSPAAARPVGAEQGERVPGERELWEALDRGEDPTSRTPPPTAAVVDETPASPRGPASPPSGPAPHPPG
jgi:uncharacterized membrane protein (TIGR02234 family)